MVTELLNSPYPYDIELDYVRFDYLLDRWDDTVENWNVLERILDQFTEDHNLVDIPVAWIFDDYNLDEELIEGRIRKCNDLLHPEIVILSMYNDILNERKELFKNSNTAEKDLIAVIEFMEWLLTVPEDIREFYHKVYDHDHDEWYLDSNKTGKLNQVKQKKS